MHVAQPASALLQVGLEQERDIAEPAVSLGDRVPEVPQPATPVSPPAVSCLAGELGPEVVVTRDGARVQEAEGGLEVAGGDRKRLLDRLDAVVEGEAGVPDRVPEPLGHPAHVRAAAVDEHQVQVTARGELSSPVAADRDERGLGFVREQVLEPLIDETCMGPAERPALQALVGEKRAASFAKGRPGPSRLCGHG